MDRVLNFAQSKGGIALLTPVAFVALERLFPKARAIPNTICPDCWATVQRPSLP